VTEGGGANGFGPEGEAKLSDEKDGSLHSNHVEYQKSLLVDERKEDEAKKWILEMKASGQI